MRRRHSRHGYPPGPPPEHGYPPTHSGYPPGRAPYSQRLGEQQPGYPPGQPQGYRDHYGNWTPYCPGQAGGQWGYGGYDGAPYVSATELAAQQQRHAEEVTHKGKGFTAKMGDRAAVKSAFSMEQRQAKVGKGFVEGGDDEYGADILVGGGGLVCLEHIHASLIHDDHI